MTQTPGTPLRRRAALLLGGGLLATGLGLAARRSGAEEGRAIPAPAEDTPAGNRSAEVAVLAGGCFWGVQGVFQHLEGVGRAVSGYAGGEQVTAQYELVTRGTTGHAEAVEVTFDPRRISFGQVLQVFFSVAHDPTQRDRQGPDFGPQYRSAIFPRGAEQERVARAYVAQLDGARIFGAPIATRIEPDRPFYAAEDYHQDFLTRHPTHPYIVVNDLPKVEALRRFFPDRFRAAPVLVAAR